MKTLSRSDGVTSKDSSAILAPDPEGKVGLDQLVIDRVREHG